MSLFFFMMAGGGGPPPGNAVLTGATVEHTTSGIACRAGFGFEPDGTIEDLGPGLTDAVQINPGEWFSNEPVAGVGSFFEIRCASIVSGTWDTEPAPVGTFIDLSTRRRWRIEVTVPEAPQTQVLSGALFEIRPIGGSVEASALFNATANN